MFFTWERKSCLPERCDTPSPSSFLIRQTGEHYSQTADTELANKQDKQANSPLRWRTGKHVSIRQTGNQRSLLRQTGEQHCNTTDRRTAISYDRQANQQSHTTDRRTAISHDRQANSTFIRQTDEQHSHTTDRQTALSYDRQTNNTLIRQTGKQHFHTTERRTALSYDRQANSNLIRQAGEQRCETSDTGQQCSQAADKILQANSAVRRYGRALMESITIKQSGRSQSQSVRFLTLTVLNAHVETSKDRAMQLHA